MLGVGTGISGVINDLLPQISRAYHLPVSTASSLYSGIWLVFSLIGWALVIAVQFRFRAEKVDTPGGHPGYPPPAGPGPDPRRPPYGA